MNRKDFIKTCGFTCAGVTAFAAFLQSCGTAGHSAQFSETADRITVKKSEFIATVNEKTVQRGYVVVKSDKFSFPICIFKISDEEYSALLMECTHRNCELQPQGDFLVCPCHGSEFTNRGAVQSPPAEENLRTFKTQTDNENIFILL